MSCIFVQNWLYSCRNIPHTEDWHMRKGWRRTPGPTFPYFTSVILWGSLDDRLIEARCFYDYRYVQGSRSAEDHSGGLCAWGLERLDQEDSPHSSRYSVSWATPSLSCHLSRQVDAIKNLTHSRQSSWLEDQLHQMVAVRDYVILDCSDQTPDGKPLCQRISLQRPPCSDITTR